MSNTVYFLLNETMPGLVKIGYTSGDVSERIRQLNTTGVPTPFKVAASFAVGNGAACEREIHRALKKYRLRDGREFFKAPIITVIEISITIILKNMDEDQVLEESSESSNGHDLEDVQVLILQMLAHDSRQYGMAPETIAERGGLSNSLSVEYKLALLKDQGLVDEHKQGRDYPSMWKITSEGIKFMFEKGLILRELLDQQT
jgi:DNA-binding transcriptional ArsR family regulator